MLAGGAMERRSFLKHSAIAAAALGAPGLSLSHSTWAGGSLHRAHDRVQLGRSGVRVSRLAQGTGIFSVQHASAQARALGTSGIADLLRAGVDQGLDFWDLADSYGTHPAAREALKTVQRDKVVILSKSMSRDAAGMRADLDRFRRELGTDHIDLVLMHFLTDPAWSKSTAGAMEALAEAKQKGIIRAHGISCHTLAALEHATTTPWVDVVLARLNPFGAMMDTDAEDVVPVLAKLKAQGKGIVGMKILGAGQLRKRVNEAIAYALQSPVLDGFSIGAESQAELMDLVARIPAVSVAWQGVKPRVSAKEQP
jgi:aryl-alcohol dehydrogenase-like predicted oxidoreductase